MAPFYTEIETLQHTEGTALPETLWPKGIPDPSFGEDGAGGGSVRTVAGAVLRKRGGPGVSENHKFSYCPKISVVVPAYRTPEIFLRQMIESLENRVMKTGNW